MNRMRNGPVTASHQEIFSHLYRKNLFLRKHNEKMMSGTAMSKDTRDSTAMVAKSVQQARATSHLIKKNINVASPLFSSKQKTGDPKLREYLNQTADQASMDNTFECSQSNSI